jgi:hypothetical protein
MLKMNEVAGASKKQVLRAALTLALGSAAILGMAGVCADSAYARPQPMGYALSAQDAAGVQSQLAAAVARVDSLGLTGSAKDAALSTAIAQVIESAVSTYGPAAAGEIGSLVIAASETAGVPAGDTGTALGQAAAVVAAYNLEGAKALARTVANEGTPGMVSSFVTASNTAGAPRVIGSIAESQPEVTGSVGPSGGVGTSFVASFAPPPPPPPPPCNTPSCT